MIYTTDGVIQLVSSIIATAAIVASFTPTPKDDGILLIAKRVLDVLAFNFGKAKNADPH